MKKSFVFAVSLFFCFAFMLNACSSGGSSSKSGFYNNWLNGKGIEVGPTSNYANVDIDNNYVYFVIGEDYDMEVTVYMDDPDNPGYIIEDNSYDTSGAIWKISGGIGYFGSEGVTTIAGATPTLTISSNAAAGVKGTLTVELDGMINRAPIKAILAIES